jgi:hypothetical protein
MRVIHLNEIREPIEIVIPCRSKIRRWAFENAYMLIVMAIFFVITWGVMIVYGIKHATRK